MAERMFAEVKVPFIEFIESLVEDYICQLVDWHDEGEDFEEFIKNMPQQEYAKMLEEAAHEIAGNDELWQMHDSIAHDIFLNYFNRREQ